MNKEAYEVLNGVRVIDLRILRLMSKRKMLESCLYPSGIRYDVDKVQGSYENQLEKLAAEISAVENDIRWLYSDKITKAAEIEKLISQVKNEECQTVLYLRFISNKRVNEIADSMSYSPDWVYKKLRKGVDEIGKIIRQQREAKDEGYTL